MRALVIEPQVFTSFMIEDALRDAGYTSVTVAATEQEAIACAEAEPPDLITAAVKLEAGNGVSAVKAIRARHDVPVLFITQRVSEVPLDEPDVGLVKKPFLAAQLSPAIAKAQATRGERTDLA